MYNSNPLLLFLLLPFLFFLSSSNSSSRCDINSEKLHVQGTAISRIFRRTSDLQVSKLVMKIFRKFLVPRYPSWEQSRSIGGQESASRTFFFLLPLLPFENAPTSPVLRSTSRGQQRARSRKLACQPHDPRQGTFTRGPWGPETCPKSLKQTSEFVPQNSRTRGMEENFEKNFKSNTRCGGKFTNWTKKKQDRNTHEVRIVICKIIRMLKVNGDFYSLRHFYRIWFQIIMKDVYKKRTIYD